jgi:PAS domain S-box-containing protein
MALAWSEERADRFEYLAQFWTLRQSVMLPGSRSGEGLTLEKLGPEIVAVEDGGLVHELLASLPEAQRPLLLPFVDHAEAMRAMLRGDATAAAGNGFTLRFAAEKEGVTDLVEIPVKALTYNLATHLSRGGDLDWVAPALASLRDSGDFEILVERNLTTPHLHLYPLGGVLAAVLAVAALALLGLLWLKRHRAPRDHSGNGARPAAAPASDARPDAELLRAISNGASVPLLMTRVDDGRILWSNRAAAELAELEPEELIGRSAVDFYAEAEDRKQILAELQRSGDVVAYQVRQRSATGQLRWLSVTARVQEVAGERVMVTAFQDISHRHDTEETQRALIAALPDLVFRLNPKGVFLDYHAPSDELLAAPPQTFLGRPASETLPPDLVAPLMDALEAARTSDTPIEYEYAAPDLKGVMRQWEARVVGLPRGEFLVLSRDITERKQVEDRLATMRASLREHERLATIGTLTAGIAHEVRNPLFAVTASLDALEVHAGPSEELDVARDQLSRIGRLADGLQELGRAPHQDRVATQAHQLVTDALTRVRELAQDRAVFLDQEVARDLPDVMVEPPRVIGALQAILDNAIRASTSQGRVRIEARTDEGFLALTVSDNGGGIDSDLSQQIFEPFFSRRRGGLGLGLAIVRRVALDHGGRVDAEPNPTGGTRVTLWLPIPGADASPEAESEGRKPLVTPHT